jgi:signal transduction histidine kinase
LQIEPDANAGGNLQSAIANLQSTHRQISDLLHDLPPAIGPDLARLGALGALRRAVETDLGGAFDQVRWEVPPAVEEAARALDALSAEVLYYAAREAVRNAARHGRGQSPGRRLCLTVGAAEGPDVGGRSQLDVCIEDDGVGFAPAPAQDEGGHGLALHSTLLAIMGGSLSVSGAPTTRVIISLPAAR